VNNNIVLFIDGISKFQRSGGRSSTDILINRMQSEIATNVYLNSLVCDNSRIFRIIFNLSSSFFVFIHRKFGALFMEFFCRFSLLLIIRVIFYLLLYRPTTIILNHHSVFWLSLFFKKGTCVFIFHDVISHKFTTKGRVSGLHKHSISCFEKFVCARSKDVWTFSVKDRDLLSSIALVKVKLLPVTELSIAKPRELGRDFAAVCVGNWYRRENSEGLLKLLSTCADNGRIGTDEVDTLPITVLGVGAESLKLTETAGVDTFGYYESLSEFSQMFLLAPITSGAGIKVKVLEAWKHDFIVIGTPLAFEGIPPEAVSVGGIVVKDIQQMADFIRDHVALSNQMKARFGARAFNIYVDFLKSEKLFD
jgi:hypothetical protein